MLAEPTIDKVLKKSGKSRYETSLLIAKRAREISAKRLETDSEEILDPVEVATYELMNGDIEFLSEEEAKEIEKKEAENKEEVVEENKEEKENEEVEEIDLDDEEK